MQRDYDIEIEIFEGSGGTRRTDGTRPDMIKERVCAWMYEGDGINTFKQGQKFRYPEDMGKLGCPGLIDSLTGVIRALEHGGTMPWTYEGTPYKKLINENGVTTEFVRCIDPTASGIVLKITRTKK